MLIFFIAYDNESKISITVQRVYMYVYVWVSVYSFISIKTIIILGGPNFLVTVSIWCVLQHTNKNHIPKMWNEKKEPKKEKHSVKRTKNRKETNLKKILWEVNKKPATKCNTRKKKQ